MFKIKFSRFFKKVVSLITINLLIIALSVNVVYYLFESFYGKYVKISEKTNIGLCDIVECEYVYDNGKFLIYDNKVFKESLIEPKYIHVFKPLFSNNRVTLEGYILIYVGGVIYHINSDIFRDTIYSLLAIYMVQLIWMIYNIHVVYRKEKEEYLIVLSDNQSRLQDKNMSILTENIHHELNTPLAVIRHNMAKIIEMLQSGQFKDMKLSCAKTNDYYLNCLSSGTCPCKCDINKCNPKFTQLRNCFDQIDSSLDIILSIMDRMNTFKQIKYSNGNKTIYDILKGASESVKLTRKSNFNIEIDDSFKNYKMGVGLANRDLLSVLIILMNNSLEAHSSNIILSCKYDNGLMKIYITDNGHGVKDNRTGEIIKKSNYNQIYKPYYSYKLDGDTDRVRGVGLYLCKNVVEKSLKGHISLIETSNSGTTFVVTTGAREFEII